MSLKVCVVDDDCDIKKAYIEHIFKHNAKVFSEGEPFLIQDLICFFRVWTDMYVAVFLW